MKRGREIRRKETKEKEMREEVRRKENEKGRKKRGRTLRKKTRERREMEERDTGGTGGNMKRGRKEGKREEGGRKAITEAQCGANLPWMLSKYARLKLQLSQVRENLNDSQTLAGHGAKDNAENMSLPTQTMVMRKP